MKVLFVLSLLVCISYVQVSALNNGLGLTPQMGWNSWNHFGCNINETLIRDTADTLVASGLAAAGYTYVNIDDCWASGRYANGSIYPDPKAFPSGMKALADYVHSKGLKFGVYSDSGNYTCAGRPGSFGYEFNDAQSYASWGVDYLKYDNCNSDGIPPELRYPTMRDALNKTGRPIFYSMCEWGVDSPSIWAPKIGNSWRTTGDIADFWDRLLYCIDGNDAWAGYAGPGAWNDPDMLEVGNGGMSFEEYRSHFSLWCLMKAPLIIGCDITDASEETLSILTNTEAIAVNQDPLGVQGAKLYSYNGLEVYAGPLADGSYAIVLFNRSDDPAGVGVTWEMIGMACNVATVRDLWAHADMGNYAVGYSATVAAHDSVFIRATPVDGPIPTVGTISII